MEHTNETLSTPNAISAFHFPLIVTFLIGHIFVGPKETVIDDTTGYLCEPEPHSFASAMEKLLEGG